MISRLFRRPVPAGLPDLLLQGGRVHLHPPQLSDWAEWADVRGRNRSFLQPFEPLWAEGCLSRDFFVRRLARQVSEWEADRHYPFLLRCNNDASLIGGININHVCRGAAQSASLGYWLSEEAQGHGFMHEGLGLAVTYAFSTLQLHRLNAATLLHNARSKNVLLKLGFAEEGRATAYLQINGTWQDHILYGLNRPADQAGATFLT